MTTLTEIVTYEPGIYQLETTDPVLGGPDGIDNLQGKQLANRTAYLKAHVDALESAAPSYVTATALQTALEKLDHKQSVRAASIGNLSLTGVQTIDGITVIVGDRVLVKNQTTASENGIYLVAGSAWSRAIDADATSDVTAGMVAEVEEGTINGAQRWQLTTPAPIVLGTTLLTFANVSAGYAPLASPVFTGTPTVPTASSGTKNTQAASTDFASNLTKGLAGINVAGGVDVSVTVAQSGAGILKLTGALTGNINLIFPTATGQWIISNEATGGFSITAKMASGTGVILPQNLAVVIYSDSTNVIFAASAGQYAFIPETFTPSVGTTSLSITGGYTPGLLMIEKNGAWLHLSDYTATDGASVTVPATIVADKFTVYAFKSFTVANAVLKSGDTMGGALALAAGSTAPNVAQGDSSTKIANTAFVDAEIAADVPAMFSGANQSLATNGYQKLPGGLIIQWGQVTQSDNGSSVALLVTFPVAFPTTALQGFLTGGNNLASGNSGTIEGLSSAVMSGFTIGAAGSRTWRWLAIGY